MFKRVLAAAAAAALSLSPAAATPSLGEAEHRLINTIRRTGTSVYLNCPGHVRWLGIYSSGHQAMAVCVEGRDPSDWTAEEQDTLRHEAVHLAQDCMGRLHDNELETTTTISKMLSIAVRSGVDLEKIEQVYRAEGADDQTILLEWEAFSLAAILSTGEVEQLVRSACGSRL